MAKTNDPHVDSFLAFATYTLEVVEAERHGTPWWLPPNDLQRLDDGTNSSIFRNQKLRHDAIIRALVQSVRDRFAKAGFPPALLESGPGRQLMREHINLQIGNHVLARDDTPPSNDRNRYGGWRPRRGIVVSVIVGTYLSNGGHSAERTASLLNRGMPEAQKVGRVTAFEVYNARDSFMKRPCRNADAFLRRGARLAAHARALETIFLTLPPPSTMPGRRRYELVERMAEDGRLTEQFENALLQQPVAASAEDELRPLLLKYATKLNRPRRPRQSA